MARRKIELFLEIHNENQFYNVLQHNQDHLVCAEVYCHFTGWCTALDRLFTTIKLDWSDGKMVLLKVPADEIEAFRRFRNQSEPVYLFILNKRVTKVFRGVDAIKMSEVAKRELYYLKIEMGGASRGRPTYALDEPTSDEGEEENVKRARRLSEMQRLARQAQEEALEAKRMQKENKKLELLKAGFTDYFQNLTALGRLNEEADQEEDFVIPEELPEDVEEESSDEEDDNEYFPPAGLLIPGLYAPPCDVAKANGLSILFPKLVAECVTPEPEFLPPHVLVMLSVAQRYTAIAVMHKHRDSIIHMGIFKATTPYDAIHVAYSVKQYDKLKLSTKESELRLAFMVSIEVDIPLLELIDLGPQYVSRDSTHGEEDCAAMFPVDYADNYPDKEDFENGSNDDEF